MSHILIMLDVTIQLCLAVESATELAKYSRQCNLFLRVCCRMKMAQEPRRLLFLNYEVVTS